MTYLEYMSESNSCKYWSSYVKYVKKHIFWGIPEWFWIPEPFWTQFWNSRTILEFRNHRWLDPICTLWILALHIWHSPPPLRVGNLGRESRVWKNSLTILCYEIPEPFFPTPDSRPKFPGWGMSDVQSHCVNEHVPETWENTDRKEGHLLWSQRETESES